MGLFDGLVLAVSKDSKKHGVSAKSPCKTNMRPKTIPKSKKEN